MTHYVLLRFAPTADLDMAEEKIRLTYRALDEALAFLHNPRIYRSCVARDSNADIMAVIDLDSEENLNAYLTHPMHLKMAQDFRELVVSRISFDHQ